MYSFIYASILYYLGGLYKRLLYAASYIQERSLAVYPQSRAFLLFQAKIKKISDPEPAYAQTKAVRKLKGRKAK